MSSTSQIYGIHGLEEARAYLNDPYLGGNLREISQALLDLEGSDASVIFGFPDFYRLRSSMTLFSLAAEENSVFQKVLEKYYRGESDGWTLELLGMK